MVKDIGEEALPESLREFLLLHLEAILQGLESHSVTGPEPLQKAIKSFATDVVARKDELVQATAAATPEGKTILKRFGAACSKAAEIASTAGKGAEGVEKVWKLASERGPQAIEWVSNVIESISK